MRASSKNNNFYRIHALNSERGEVAPDEHTLHDQNQIMAIPRNIKGITWSPSTP